MAYCKDITPRKFTGTINTTYRIPASCRFTIPRTTEYASPLIYYLSLPKTSKPYPLTVLCTGSSTKDSVYSCIHIHRHFLQECLDLNAGLITVEQWGVDGNHNIDVQTFMNHYTRTQRLTDHQTILDHLLANPPTGWDGTFIFIGISEGGALVTSLTQLYQPYTRATINFCGAPGWGWHKELWAFIKHFQKQYRYLCAAIARIPYVKDQLPFKKEVYLSTMKEAAQHPNFTKTFMGMTYAYHADALTYPFPDYTKIQTPFLLVAGSKDPAIGSFDLFVTNAKKARCPITYLRVNGMDHYVRKRPAIIKQAFAWLQKELLKTKKETL